MPGVVVPAPGTARTLKEVERLRALVLADPDYDSMTNLTKEMEALHRMSVRVKEPLDILRLPGNGAYDKIEAIAAKLKAKVWRVQDPLEDSPDFAVAFIASQNFPVKYADELMAVKHAGLPYAIWDNEGIVDFQPGSLDGRWDRIWHGNKLTVPEERPFDMKLAREHLEKFLGEGGRSRLEDKLAEAQMDLLRDKLDYAQLAAIEDPSMDIIRQRMATRAKVKKGELKLSKLATTLARLDSALELMEQADTSDIPLENLAFYEVPYDELPDSVINAIEEVMEDLGPDDYAAIMEEPPFGVARLKTDTEASASA